MTRKAAPARKAAAKRAEPNAAGGGGAPSRRAQRGTAKTPAAEFLPPSPPTPPVGDDENASGDAGALAAAVQSAVDAMTWLKPSDRGTVELALTYARQIDESLKAVDRVAGLEPEIAKLVLENATKALYLGPHLLNTLRALGGAPAERKALKIEEAARGKLGELRDKAKARGLAVLEGGAAG